MITFAIIKSNEMKKFLQMAAVLSLISLGVSGCFGPNEQEEAAKEKTEDSLMEIDRSSSVDEADRMLREADSLEQLRQDSIDKAGKK